MKFNKDDLKEITDYLGDKENVLLINSGDPNNIHKLISKAYQELTTEQYVYVYYVLLKCNLIESYTDSNDDIIIEKYGASELKVSIDFSKLQDIFHNFENYRIAKRDEIDFATCLNLIEDTYEVVKNWNYDDPSTYSDIQEYIDNGYVHIDSDNEHTLTLFNEEDQQTYLQQAAADATLNCVIDDIDKQATDALLEAIKPISSNTEVLGSGLSIIISKDVLLKYLDDTVEDWLAEIDYTHAEGSLIPAVIGYCLSQNYDFNEPYNGFDTSFNDKQFNDALKMVLDNAD